MTKENLFIQILKRLIIGIICFIVIYFLGALSVSRMGLYTLFAFALLIGYPQLVDIILDIFFKNKLYKYQFLRSLHFIIWIIAMIGYLGTITEGSKDSFFIGFPFYSFIYMAVFSIKRQLFLRRQNLK